MLGTRGWLCLIIGGIGNYLRLTSATFIRIYSKQECHSVEGPPLT